ncbi:IQ domain-containing protein K [Paragonimus skrjabini miyazakii]|uniref:IQ domain-containing protein K n=1 Tax=Paragonimus skrjabini miyazakii TaxID=59628 RepID=A0A8S9YT71_9TREM|nr:IQ domain-containing protein K [Paragonimus skrjabini miyazakii]
MSLWERILVECQIEKENLFCSEKSVLVKGQCEEELMNVATLPYDSLLVYSSQCSPTEYLQVFIFPLLLPAMEAMLHEAKRQKCFERRRFGFSGLDFLTLFLYQNNPLYVQDRRNVTKLNDIPWVSDHWEQHPRPPLPLSLQWTEEEAAAKIQAYWRGVTTRRIPEVRELLEWQHQWRMYNRRKQAAKEDGI